MPESQLALDASNSIASFSADRRYRYSLHRWWEPQRGLVMFVGLNPSTADETENDPTIRRCMRFARDWGYGGLVMVNLYAFRATNPREMNGEPNPVGNPENDAAIVNLAQGCALVVCAWGAELGPFPARNREVRALLMGARPHVLGFTKGGYPRHPLYMPIRTRPFLWN